MTTFAIRLLALVTMLIDHLGYRLFPSISWLRWIGRLAFPLFCFLIAEGFYHTRNRGRYALRLLLLAVVSEVPYDLFTRNRLWYFGGQNVFWTLLLGLLAAWWVWALRKDKLPFLQRRAAGETKAKPGVTGAQVVLAILGVGAAGALAYFLNTDYAFYGVALIVMFSLLREEQMPLQRLRENGVEKKDALRNAMRITALAAGVVFFAAAAYYANGTYACIAVVCFVLFSLLWEKPLWSIAGFSVLVAGYVWYSLQIGRGSWAYTQFYGALAAVPILLYNGKPGPRSKAMQWCFYFFYPAHILVLWAIWQFLLPVLRQTGRI